MCVREKKRVKREREGEERLQAKRLMDLQESCSRGYSAVFLSRVRAHARTRETHSKIRVEIVTICAKTSFLPRRGATQYNACNVPRLLHRESDYRN